VHIMILIILAFSARTMLLYPGPTGIRTGMNESPIDCLSFARSARNIKTCVAPSRYTGLSPVRVVILINFTLDYCIDRHPRHPSLKIPACPEAAGLPVRVLVRFNVPPPPPPPPWIRYSAYTWHSPPPAPRTYHQTPKNTHAGPSGGQVLKMNFYNPNPLHPLTTKNIEAKSLSLARMQDSWWQSVQSSESSICDEHKPKSLWRLVEPPYVEIQYSTDVQNIESK
jgi:hypothetical protein